MSAIFGAFSRSQQPFDPGILTRMGESIPWYGPDGGGQWCSDQVGMGHLLHCVTPESRHERQPLVHASGRFVLVAKARLDNRTELIDQLSQKRSLAMSLSDPDLIMAAYAAWGPECAARLLGDFAFAVWDKADRKLVCVRDQIGLVPFYYHLSPDHFVFACDVRAVIAHPAVPNTLNDAAIAMHLYFAQYVMPRMTYLAGVEKLPPATILTVTPDKVHEQVYWSPQSVAEVRLPNDAAYVEQMAEEVKRAVHCRLRSLHPVGAHVSGGLDSSAIAVIAMRQLQAQDKGLTGYSWLPTPQSDDDMQAPEYVATQHIAALGITVENVDLTAESVRARLERDVSLDGYTDLFYEPLVRQRAKTHGIRVLLSGWGGDEVASAGGQGYLAELFRRGDWRQLLRLIKSRSRSAPDSWRHALRLFYGQVLLPILPSWLKGIRRGAAMQPLDGFTNIAPAFAAAVPETLPWPESAQPVGLHAAQAYRLMRGFVQARLEVWATQGARDGIEYRYPLLDRKLIEFCLGVPAHLFMDEQYSRSLFRQAATGLLPDTIRCANLKLELGRVARYIEVVEAGCAQWLAEACLDDSNGRGSFTSAARYFDLAAIRAQLPNIAVRTDRISRLIGCQQQIQVLVMTRNRCHGEVQSR